MAIGSGDQIQKFGTETTVSAATPGAITNTSFSVAGDVATAPAYTAEDTADIVALFEGAFSSSPDVGGEVVLYARPMNIQGSNDAPQPDVNFEHYAIGYFPVDAVTSTQYLVLAAGFASLPNYKAGQVYEFYLRNLAGATLSSGWVLRVTARAPGPKA